MNRAATPDTVVTLLGEPRDVHVARAFARRAAHLHGLDGAADDVVLVVSELVTNAVTHGQAPITLAVSFEADSAVVWVTDTGGADPKRKDPSDDDEGGRGLLVVSQLSTEWHVSHSDGTTSVIARVPITAPAIPKPRRG